MRRALMALAVCTHLVSAAVADGTVPLPAGSPATGTGSGQTQRPPPTRRVRRRTRNNASSAGALTVLTKRDEWTMSIHSVFRCSAAPPHPTYSQVLQLGHSWATAEATGGRV